MTWPSRGGKKKHAKYLKKPANKEPAREYEEEENHLQISAGHITSFESQKKNSKRISIFLDGAFAFGLHQDTLLNNNLYAGRYLDESAIAELLASDALLRAKETAIKFLGHRARSAHEVTQKLKGKGFDDEIIVQVIKRLNELSYLDDERFAHNFARSRFNNKGHGPQRIRTELYRFGISPPLIEQTLQKMLDEEDLFDSAFSEAEKRLRRIRNETDLTKKRRKLFDFLMRRGHTAELARKVIDNLDLHS